MPIEQLTEEQIRTWSLEQKDRWWLERVYRGNTPQLTFRAAITGFLLGGILCSTNLYIGAKTGWSLGVGVTSVILAFAFFRLLHRIGIANDISILENNCSQSVATSAAYMTGPLISSLVAYMIVTDRLLPWYQIVLWNTVTSLLGVLFAFPLKRLFINDQQAPFPEGRAAGVVLDTLHHSEGTTGIRHARILMIAASLAATVKFFQAEAIQTFLQVNLLRLKQAAEDVWHLPEQLDGLWKSFGLQPRIYGTKVEDLTMIPALDLPLIGAGGLMGIRAGTSLLVGALLNYAVLAPIMIHWGEITPSDTGSFGLKRITLWSLWPGVACLVVASIAAMLASPKLLLDPFKAIWKRKSTSHVLSEIELPIKVSLVGIPILLCLAAYLANSFFGVGFLEVLYGLPLMFVLTIVAASSTAATSITPLSASAKITQLFYGVVSPQNIRTNLATAGMTGEVVSNASNLLMDLKPGYMLGAKPRLQAIAHVIGILSGSIFSVPLFYLMFTQNVATDGVASIQSEAYPMPSATTWMAVAQALTQGLDALPGTVRYAVLVAVLVGVALEVARVMTRGRFPLLAVPMGLAFVIDFTSSLSMFTGAFILWCLGVGRERESKAETVEGPLQSPLNSRARWWSEHHEPICAGVIAGASLVGVAETILAGYMR